MPSFADTLNVVSKPFFDVVEEGYTPSEYIGLTEGMTGFNSVRDDVFTLNPPIAGAVRDLRGNPGIDISLQPEGDRFILRGIIGYAMAASALSNPTMFILKLSNMINSMTGAAYKVYGPRIQRLTFDHPGLPGDFFRELEYSAGYEIRLHGELIPAVVPLEMETVNE